MPDVHLAALDIGSRRWYEIDDAQDLDIAEALFASDDERPRRLAARFGGYWRFPQLIDFAYLANPHYPPPRLLEETNRAYFEMTPLVYFDGGGCQRRRRSSSSTSER